MSRVSERCTCSSVALIVKKEKKHLFTFAFDTFSIDVAVIFCRVDASLVAFASSSTVSFRVVFSRSNVYSADENTCRNGMFLILCTFYALAFRLILCVSILVI